MPKHNPLQVCETEVDQRVSRWKGVNIGDRISASRWHNGLLTITLLALRSSGPGLRPTYPVAHICLPVAAGKCGLLTEAPIINDQSVQPTPPSPATACRWQLRATGSHLTIPSVASDSG